MKKIIVDIDNTLWDLAPVFFEYLKRYNPEIPIEDLQRGEMRLKGYIPREDLFGVLKDIHMKQEEFQPYPEAKDFLSALKEMGLYIIIASIRDEEAREATEGWLKKHKLAYDELHLGNDKTVLFHDSWAIVDDSTWTLDKAAQAGIVRTGLVNVWNANRGHSLFPSLKEVLEYLKQQCDCLKSRDA
jgi:phosphoglycolate phosphatase-like HAD superfamily hydrolase